MASKNQIYGLDEIGYAGTQNRTRAQIEKDAKLTGEYIKALKAKKEKPTLPKSKKRLSKTK